VTRQRVSEPPLIIRIRKFTYRVAAAIAIAIVLLAGLMLARGGYDTRAMVTMGIGLAVSTIVGHRHEAYGAAQCDHPQACGGRGAGFVHVSLLRQDRHPDG
jgi:hypothetical protein